MRKKKRDPAQTRQAILDAAEELFCNQGVAASTLERISRQAGVTRGALYWHFDDKADLLQALHERCLSAQNVLIRCAAETGHDDPLGLLENAAVDMLSSFENDVHQQRIILIMNSSTPDEESAAWLRQINADLFRTLSLLIRQADVRGQLTPDFPPEEVAVILLATVNGLLTEWLRSDKSFPLADLGARLMRRQMEMFRRVPAPEDAASPPSCP